MKSKIASIVIPAYNEQLNIGRTVETLNEQFGDLIELLIVVDSESDETAHAFYQLSGIPSAYSVLIQNLGGGPSNAIRFGIEKASADCIIVMMADGSDDTREITELVNLVSRGVAIACASRYMPGGQQIGGPRMKKFISKGVGRILYIFAGVGTHDPTNSYKAYSRNFLEEIQIESRAGFEIGLELISKARHLRLPIAEVPTIWLDRTTGSSRFMLLKWAPKYLRWFFHCFGPRRSI